jgi:hypothetical protein
MAKVLPIHLNAAIAQADAISLAEKELQFDTIFQEQPNLLASVLVQQQMGNTLEQMEVLLNLLLVILLSLRQANVKLPTVSEDKQEQQLQRLIGTVLFMDDLDRSTRDSAFNQMIEQQSEKWLFAYAWKLMIDAGFPYLEYENSKYLTLCGLNLVNCL